MDDDISKWLAAKSGRNDRSIWLPLRMHLEDTSDMMGLLVNQWLPDSEKRAMDLPGDEEELVRMAKLLGGLHDIGKATPLFQSMILQNIDEVGERLDEMGLPVSRASAFVNRKESSHPLAGETVLLKMGFPAGVASVVGAHHGKPRKIINSLTGDLIAEQLSLVSSCHMNYYDSKDMNTSGIWRSLRGRIVDEVLRGSGYAEIKDIPEISYKAQVLFTGLLIMADWIASNTEYFPLISSDDCGDEQNDRSRMQRAWNSLALPECWASSCIAMDDAGFQNRFGFMPNAVQKAMIKAAEQSEHPGIYILEAPMGVGKTEAALAAASIQAGKYRCGGLYFGLPTQATSNGIFPRIESWARSEAEEETGEEGDQVTLGIRLAHGAAEMNDDYRSVFHGTAQINDDGREDTNLIVHPWFEGRKQALLTDFVIGTVDQFLMTALKQKHVMLRHLGIAGKVVIIDECHAYDAYMNQYLEMALCWMGAYGVPVILLSATLPYERRSRLIRSYQQLNPAVPDSEKESWMVSKSYPLLTWTDGRQVKQKRIAMTGGKRMVRILKTEEANLISLLRDKLADGGCAGIIVNTVKRAQTLARTVLKELPDENIIVYHAGFTMEQRAALEKELLRRLGPGSGPEERNHLVVIGTQVIEQSLDIDFDFLVTDLCPVDLLLQRIGRLHRHARHDAFRPVGMKQAVCAVVGAGAEDETEAGSKAVYGEYLLLRTREILPDRILLPTDISELVQDVYDRSFVLQPETERHAEEDYDRKIKDKQKRANAYRLSPPVNQRRRLKQKTIDGMLDEMISNDVEAEACVRDGQDSVEAILLQYVPEKHALTPLCDPSVLLLSDERLSEEEEKLVFRQKIRLPAVFGRGDLIDRVIRELENMTNRWVGTWVRENRLLMGELFMVLDEKGKGILGGYSISYSNRLGFQYEKVGNENENS